MKISLLYNNNNDNDNNNDNNNDKLGIRIVEMEGKDIQRSPIVAKLLDIYNYEKPCGKPIVSHNAPSFYKDSGVVNDNDWSNGVENVVHPNEIVSIENKISHYPPSEIENNVSDNVVNNNDAALTPLKYTKSKHFPKDSRL